MRRKLDKQEFYEDIAEYFGYFHVFFFGKGGGKKGKIFGDNHFFTHQGLKHKLWVEIFVLILALSFLMFTFKTRANIAYFYPSSCLGSWQNPANAEGEPQIKDQLDGRAFNSENSAVMTNSPSEIYCGAFEGAEPENTKPNRFFVNLAWYVDDGQLDHSIPVADEVEGVVDDSKKIKDSIYD